MKKTLIFLLTTVLSVSLFAQNEIDALRYSTLNNNGGTARFSSMSGAYGAVGADFSSLSQNPAGIAFYRKSEFSISPSFNNGTTWATFSDNENKDFRNTLYLGNVGYVLAVNLNEKNGSHLKMLQFGFGVNRLATFNNRMLISGYNTTNSLMTQYLDAANQTGSNPGDLDNFGNGLAYDVYLLDADSLGWFVDMPNGNVQQTKAIETRGGITETVLSMGTNFEEKLFMGITFGFPHINYQETSTYTEKDINGVNSYFKSFERSESLTTKGSGFNFKMGFIYKPCDYFRIGGAFHSPTSYGEMNDTYNASMTANYDQAVANNSNATTFSSSSPDGSFDYKITTPMRAIGSVALILGQHGLVSADYEYVDYTTARLRFSDAVDFDDMNKANNAIHTQYTTASNFRIGAELKEGIMAIRGGYNYAGSPYKDAKVDGTRKGYSFGFGIRDKGYFVDFAYNHTSTPDSYYIYGIAPTTYYTTNTNSYTMTVGLKF